MNAVTFGRYNFFTIAHLETIKEILSKWEKLYILIVDDDLGKTNDIIEQFEEFYNLCDYNHNTKKIYFSIEERKKMIEYALEGINVKERVNVIHYCRPEYNIKKFNAEFKMNEFDLVFPYSDNEASYYDKIRNNSFENILHRSVSCVYPKLTIHVSQILSECQTRKKINDILPIGTREYFESIDGYSRILS